MQKELLWHIIARIHSSPWENAHRNTMTTTFHIIKLAVKAPTKQHAKKKLVTNATLWSTVLSNSILNSIKNTVKYISSAARFEGKEGVCEIARNK